MPIHEKLKTIQSELKAPKGQRNTFGNYNYRSCEDILEAVKPLAHAQGCIVTLTDTIVEVGGRVYVKATAEIRDGDTAIFTDAFARESEEKKGMDSAQITGAASSYARKYALNGLFCIDDTKDADTVDNTKETAKPAPAKPAAALTTANAATDASHDDLVLIDELCIQTKTDKLKLYEHYFVANGVVTKQQSIGMIAALKKKLAGMPKEEPMVERND
ncbi:MAG: hypothetical protein JWP89_2591 [Schlesneria sp.]|nr:hypothetical protein [Schlesneria sp.]